MREVVRTRHRQSAGVDRNGDVVEQQSPWHRGNDRRDGVLVGRVGRAHGRMDRARGRAGKVNGLASKACGQGKRTRCVGARSGWDAWAGSGWDGGSGCVGWA